jgi:tetratricopeptide (TPR) repeat protein
MENSFSGGEYSILRRAVPSAKRSFASGNGSGDEEICEESLTVQFVKQTLALGLFILLCTRCAPSAITPGPQTPAPGAAEYQLAGQYHKDKFFFFPYGRNPDKERLFSQALDEGAGGEILKPDVKLSAEENLAVEYDARSFVVLVLRQGRGEYGVVLGKVGRWKEAVDQFTEVVRNNPSSTGAWGNLGVAEHARGNYNNGAQAFEKALTVDPSYFENRKLQQKIWEASKDGRAVIP